MSFKLAVAFSALAVAALSSLLGLWMNRDKDKQASIAWFFSILIVLATLVNVAKAYVDEQANRALREDVARILESLDQLAEESGDENLAAYVGGELNAQSRSNPDVVRRFANRVESRGGDANAALGRHLSASEHGRMGKTLGRSIKTSGGKAKVGTGAKKKATDGGEGDDAGAASKSGVSTTTGAALKSSGRAKLKKKKGN